MSLIFGTQAPVFDKSTIEAKPLIFEVHGRIGIYATIHVLDMTPVCVKKLIRTKEPFHHPEGAASDGWEQQELQNRDPLPLRR